MFTDRTPTPAHAFVPDLLTEDLAPHFDALLRHPLWTAIEEGRATPAQLRTFALQDAWLVRHSPQLEALLVAHAPDEAARAVLAKKHAPKAVFAPGEPGHLSTFGAAFGLTRADFEAAEPLAGCAALTAGFYYALAREGFLGYLASLAASESVFIELCLRASPALRRHHGLTEEQVAFFDLHDLLREGVDGGEADLLRRLAVSDADREVVTRAVKRTLGFERLFYDTVYRAG